MSPLPPSDRRCTVQAASVPGLPACMENLSPTTQVQGTWEGPDDPLSLQLTEMALKTPSTKPAGKYIHFPLEWQYSPSLT